MMWARVIFCAVVGITTCVAGPLKNAEGGKTDGPLSADDFPYFTTLDSDKNFELKWNFNSTHIVFHTRVKTTGYIGFGISDHGSMYPSDVIIAWVKDGQVHFEDRHATGHSMPAVDKHQDWTLVSGSEDGQYTTIVMVRPLDTCDPEDKAISSGTTRLIYSYSPIDPVSDAYVHYHGNTRGTKSVLLLDPPADENEADQLPDDVITVDFLHSNYSVPSAYTTYACRAFKLPPLKGKHHMIRYQPVIQKGHEKLVHHMLIYYCTEDLSEDLLEAEGYHCYNDRPSALRKCELVLLAWAIGGTAFDYPSHVGYSMGDTDDPAYFRLEVHYDNPQMKDDFVDSSGMRLFLTKQLRQHDAGIIEAGVSVDEYQIIPPHYPNFLSQGPCVEQCIGTDAGIIEAGVNVDDYQIIPPYYPDFLSQGPCVEQCIGTALGDKEIHIFADFLHSHLLGRKLRTRHIRNGVELAPILEDYNYDFNYQETRMLPVERTVKKGDSFITECYYDSTGRHHNTYGGLSTKEEMCLSYLLYYPKISLSRCNARPQYNVPNQWEIFSRVGHMDFANSTVREEFVNLIKDDVIYSCTYRGRESDVSTAKTVVDKPYHRPEQCQNH